MDWLTRLKYRFIILINHGEELNKRVDIENILFDMAKGKRALPTREECRVIALKLGTPVKYWRDEWH